MRGLLILSMFALAGCASSPPPALVSAPVVAAPMPEHRPAPPAGFARSFASPPRDQTGHYITPSSGISDAEAIWHVRAALNVAALACRQSDMAPAYNAMLKRMATPFAAADAGTTGVYRARFAADWRDAHDDAMTRLYNWFAQPHGGPGLCLAAAAALTEAQTLDPARLSDFAGRHLPLLEAPFVDGYRRWDAYRVADAHWRSRYEVPLAMLRLDRSAAR